MTSSGGYIPPESKGSGDPETVIFSFFSNKRNTATMSKKLLTAFNNQSYVMNKHMKNPAGFFHLPVRITRHAIKIKIQPHKQKMLKTPSQLQGAVSCHNSTLQKKTEITQA